MATRKRRRRAAGRAVRLAAGRAVRRAAGRIARRPAAVLLTLALIVAVALEPSALSIAGLAIVAGYQALRFVLPMPREAWPPR